MISRPVLKKQKNQELKYQNPYGKLRVARGGSRAEDPQLAARPTVINADTSSCCNAAAVS